MNANRLNSLVIPVLGAGHGGTPTIVALLFNLLALRSCLSEDIGRHLGGAFTIFDRIALELTDAAVAEVLSRAMSA